MSLAYLGQGVEGVGSNDGMTQPSEPDESAQGETLRTLVPCVTAGVPSLGATLSISYKGSSLLHHLKGT